MSSSQLLTCISCNKGCQNSWLALEAHFSDSLREQPSLKPRSQGNRFWNLKSNRYDVQKSWVSSLGTSPSEWPLLCRRPSPLSSQGMQLGAGFCQGLRVSFGQSLKLRKVHHWQASAIFFCLHLSWFSSGKQCFLGLFL